MSADPVASAQQVYYSDHALTLLLGDAVEQLRTLPDGSVDCVVTSPPYYCQRDYDHPDQYGLEATPDLYVASLVAVFAEVHRVLADDGTCWINLGDTYYSAKGKPHGTDARQRGRRLPGLRPVDGPGLGLPRKSLIGIPWRVALALQTDGWTLRSAIVWDRITPLGEPTASDRPWRRYETVFLLSKGPRYHFDRAALDGEDDVWRIAPERSAPGHPAPFPAALPRRCILAGSPAGGLVLDPFSGGGSTGVAALATGRRYLGIDLNSAYHDIALRRMSDAVLPLEG